MISNELGPLTEMLDYRQKAGAAQEKNEKSTFFSVKLMRSQVLYQAAQ